MVPFFGFYLRTSDVEAARAFYSTVLGPRNLEIVKLHEQAVARGARPHWLGFLDVGDVDRAVASFTASGASSLGPKWLNPEGLEAAMMRDPGGALVALAHPPSGFKATTADVVWHLLNTPDVERAKAAYRELAGWDFQEPVDLGNLGVFHPFAWERGGPAVGSMTEIGNRPGVHPHWLFHFRVAALEPAMDAIRSGGGTVVANITLPTGERIAVADDPQGAAFTIQEHQPKR